MKKRGEKKQHRKGLITEGIEHNYYGVIWLWKNLLRKLIDQSVTSKRLGDKMT